MKTTSLLCCLFGILLLCAPGALADEGAKDPPKGDKPVRVEVGKNVYFEKDGDSRRVVIEAAVCLREGQLEQLLTRKQGKEHEAILAVDGDARHIQAALLLTGAKAGSTVKYEPKFTPPTGTKIKVTLRYVDKETGKTVTVPAQKWIRSIKDKKKTLDTDWVFAGSHFIPNQLDPKKPDYFLANDGDVICVANFDTALLDLPFASSKDNDDLAFEANTEIIPPKGTPVTIILEPMLEKK